MKKDEPVVLVAGPKGSGKTIELIRIAHDKNIPFVVRDKAQFSEIKMLSENNFLSIRIMLVEDLRREDYQGPVVVDKTGDYFNNFDWEYIHKLCFVYAESRDAGVVINTNKSHKSQLIFMILGGILSSILCGVVPFQLVLLVLIAMSLSVGLYYDLKRNKK